MPEVRLIDANALAESDMAKLIDKYLYNQCNLTVGLAAALMPTIEPEVRRGRWIKKMTTSVCNTFECSECKSEITANWAIINPEENDKFCYNCGARMDGGADNG